jgi:hypothetical protein
MTASGKGRVHYAWVVLATVTTLLLAASSVRSSFGVFIRPMEAEFGWDRTSMSSYTVAFHSAAALAFVAAALVLAIRERPMAARPPAPPRVGPDPARRAATA